MKKVLFYLNETSSGCLALLCEISNFARKVDFNLKSNVISIEGIAPEKEDEIFSLITKKYEIISINVTEAFEESSENIVEETTENVAEEPEYVVSESINKHEESVGSDKTEEIKYSTQENQLTIFARFDDPDVESTLNNLVKDCYWAIYSKNIPKEEIIKHLKTARSDMYYDYFSSLKEKVKISVGDVVACDYGKRLPGEVRGSRVLALVVKIFWNDTALLVPIFGKNGYSKYDVRVLLNEEIVFDSKEQNEEYAKYFENGGNTFILKLAATVSVIRIKEVIGHLKPEIFNRIALKLPSVFTPDSICYMDNEKIAEDAEEITGTEVAGEITEVTCEENEDSNKEELSITESEVSSEGEEERNSEAQEEVVDQDEVIVNKETTNEFIMKYFEDVLKKASKDVCSFLRAIDFCPSSGEELELVNASFAKAVELKKITFNNMISELYVVEVNNELSEQKMGRVLKACFKKWILKHPQLIEKNSCLSIVSFWKFYKEWYNTK